MYWSRPIDHDAGHVTGSPEGIELTKELDALGLPAGIGACLFDLDGVLTSTAELHRQAWKHTFDSFLAEYAGPEEAPFSDEDYSEYVDGLPRLDGTRAFLQSRGVDLPEGTAEDTPGGSTVHAVANRKNELITRLLAERGVHAFPGAMRYLRAVRELALAIGVVTSSANATHVLASAELTDYVDVLVDGRTLQTDGLRGKPAPDAFLAGAEKLEFPAHRIAVYEDAVSGVQAGVAGGFGHVIGIDRADQADRLRDAGADVVVCDLAELLKE